MYYLIQREFKKEMFETVDIQMVDEEVDGKLEQGQDIEYWNVMGRTKIMRIKTS